MRATLLSSHAAYVEAAAAALLSLSAERDAQERTIAGMNEAHAKLVEDWSVLRTERDALAADNARLREALEEMHVAAESGNFYADHDEACARLERARAALGARAS